MPQEFQILRCFSCETYQVHIIKKANKKWTCKLCGEKQSTIKIFGTGSAKDCRIHVQKLNLARGDKVEEVNFNEDSEALPTKSPPAKRRNLAGCYGHASTGLNSAWNTDVNFQGLSAQQQNIGSKWSSYLSNEDEEKDLAESYPEISKLPDFGVEDLEQQIAMQPFTKNPKSSYRKKEQTPGYRAKGQEVSTKSFRKKDLNIVDDYTHQQLNWKASTSNGSGKQDQIRLELETLNENFASGCEESRPSNKTASKQPKSTPASKWSLYVDDGDANGEEISSYVTSKNGSLEENISVKTAVKEHKSGPKSVPLVEKSSKWSAFLDGDEEESGSIDWDL